MNETTTAVEDQPAIEHEEAMHIAEVEYERLLALVDQLAPEDWSRPTDCPDWDVRALLGHLLGMFKRNADKAEAARQGGAAAQIARLEGCLRIDAMTGLQVQEHAHLTTGELVRELHLNAERSLAGRRDSSAEERAAMYETGIPGESPWTIGFLLDLIHTRDPWIHRVDICRATGRDLVVTADHDGRITADVVREWARRHGRPFTLVLDGPAGGTFRSGDDGPRLQLDAIDFCRILSGRGSGDGLLATRVPF